MRWLIRLGCWMFCGEFLLWTRGFLPPRVLLGIGVALSARLVLIAGLPQYVFYALFWKLTAGLFLLRYVLALGKKSRRLRAHYQVPETGLPWTALITGVRPTPTAFGAFVFEPAVTLALAYVLVTQSQGLPLLPQAEWRYLVPYEVEMWLRPYLAPALAWARLHAVLAALLQLAIPAVVLVLHNLYEWRVAFPRTPREAQAQRPAPGQEPPQALTFDPVWVQRR